MPSTLMGTAQLPDIGTLSYNTVVWTQLYTSKVLCEFVKDSSGRTTKYVAYTITVDGVVTIQTFNAPNSTIDPQLTQLKLLLSAPGGVLTYSGKGFGPFIINQPNGRLRDVNWGPKPTVMEFIPLGGSRSAKCVWTVTTWIPEFLAPVRLGDQVCEFTQTSSNGYDADTYSHISISGTLEIPLTRPTQNNVTLSRTVDNFREKWMSQVSDGIDLTRFKIIDREFSVSADCRTLNWSFRAEEQAPMANPVGAPTATGEFTVRPAKTVPLQAMTNWICTLRGTYTIVKQFPRRLAYLAFLDMWIFRMNQSQLGFFNDPGNPGAAQNANAGAFVSPQAAIIGAIIGELTGFAGNNQIAQGGIAPSVQRAKAIPISFSFREGLYEESKTVTFEAQWRLLTSIQTILLATGIWRAPPNLKSNLWAASIADVSGWRGNSVNQVDPATVAIVDFGHTP